MSNHQNDQQRRREEEERRRRQSQQSSIDSLMNPLNPQALYGLVQITAVTRAVRTILAAVLATRDRAALTKAFADCHRQCVACRCLPALTTTRYLLRRVSGVNQ